MSMWEYIRTTNKMTKVSVAKETNVSRKAIYLFEKGKLINNKLMSYYLKLSGREIDLKLAKILDEDYEEYYRELRSE